MNEMFKTTRNNNGNRKNRHATYNLDCNVLLKIFSKNDIINRLFFVLKNGFIMGIEKKIVICTCMNAYFVSI